MARSSPNLGGAIARRQRLDLELVRRALAPSRSAAQALVNDGLVTVSGAIASKPGRLVDPGEAVEVIDSGPRFVSRGGEKLVAALDRFGVDVVDKRAIDAGSSTGGFTDCLLQRGADVVVAIDVGRHQLHEKLRADPRVQTHEQTNIRHLDIETVGGRASIVVADLSFISLRTVAESLAGFMDSSADLVVLVKPQFEAGRAEASKGRGVIRDPGVWERTLVEACGALNDLGAAMMGVMVSPIRGGDGNVEFLVHFKKSPESTPVGSAALAEMCRAVVATVEAPS